MDAEIGLRELRQNAREVIRRAEAGETFTVTVAGREAARLGPIQTWRTWADASHIFDKQVDPALAEDLSALAHDVSDPWERG
ncbi:MAG: type II toxin-antitoxin system Phd/YefM family antitoxin [Actinomycetales bacterium]